MMKINTIVQRFCFFCLLSFIFYCGKTVTQNEKSFSETSVSDVNLAGNVGKDMVNVNFDINHDGINLDDEGTGLELIDLGSVNLLVSGCVSGYTQTFSSSGSIKLYLNDQNCVVKIVSFVSNSETYQVLNGGTLDSTGNSFDPVLTHITTFQSTTNSAHILYAQVINQLPTILTGNVTVQFNLFALNKATNFSTSITNNILRVSSTETSIDTNQDSQQTVSFMIHRVSQPDTNPLAVNYSLTGNAIAGTDYTAPSGTITIAGTDTTTNVDISVAAKSSLPDFTKTLEFNFESGNYFSYPVGLITLTNSLVAEPTTGNLVLHYDNTSITSSGSSVTGWSDLTSGDNATQSNSSNTPTLGTGSGNVQALSSVDFNGTNQYLVIPNSSSVNTSSSAYTGKVITLAFVTGSDVSRTQFLYSQGTSTYGLNVYLQSGNIYANGWQMAGTTWGPKYVSAPVSANTFYTFSLAFDSAAGTIKGFLSGSLSGTVTGVKSLTASGTVNGLGGSTSSTRLHTNTAISNMGSSTCYNSLPCFFGGQILEFSYFNGILTDTAIKGHHYFLMNKIQKNLVSINKYTQAPITELSGTISKAFQVILLQPSSSDLTIQYTVDSSSTAVANSDYVPLSGSVTVPAGYTSAFIPVTTIHNTGSNANRSLKLNLSTNANYGIKSSALNASINILDTDGYIPANTLVWWNAPQGMTINSVNQITSWNDISSNTNCTHPLSAYQNTVGIPTYNANTGSSVFDGASMFYIDSTTCIDNLNTNILQESFAMVFKTGSDVTSDQILYEQGNSNSGLSLAITNGYLSFSAYKSWKRNASTRLSPNTLYAVILEFNGTNGLQNYLSSGLGTTSVSWVNANSTSPNSGLTGMSNNGIGIGGVRNGAMFYSYNSRSYLTVASSTSNVNFVKAGTQVYELIILNSAVYTAGGSGLSNLQSYFVTKYQR